VASGLASLAGVGLVLAPSAGAVPDPVADGVLGASGAVARVERVARVTGALEVTVSVTNRGAESLSTSALRSPRQPDVSVGVSALDPRTGRVGSVRVGSGGCECGALPSSLEPGEQAAVVLRLDDPGGTAVDLLFETFHPVPAVAVIGDPPAAPAGRLLRQRVSDLPPRHADLAARMTKDGARTSGSERVDLDTDVLFAFGSAKLSRRAGKTIDAAVAVLEAQPKRKLAVYGHTDGVGSDAANLTLSRRRAAAVRAALAAKLGSGWTFEVRGFGETRPTAAERTPEGRDYPAGRALNRRVELKVIG